jgi:hypothetical protein
MRSTCPSQNGSLSRSVSPLLCLSTFLGPSHMISWPRRSSQTVVLFMSHPRDDSYTPSKISIRAGTSVHDLQEVRMCEFQKPDGWIAIPLRPMDSTEDGMEVEG